MIMQACTDDGTVVRFCGELDIATAPPLQAHLLDLIEGGHRIVIDLAEVAFMDTSGLEALLACQRRAEQMGTVLVLRRPPERVHRLLELTGLTPCFRIEANRLTLPGPR